MIDRKHKEKIIKKFDIDSRLKKELLNKDWKEVFDTTYPTPEQRSNICKGFELIDKKSFTSYADDIEMDIFWSDDDYTLMESADKYYIEHRNYMPGGGSDYWCYLIEK